MKKDFTPNTIEENTQFFAGMLPSGQPFDAKNIYNSNLRKLLRAFSTEGFRVQNKIYELSEEFDITKTVNLIEAWESLLGIPDQCFDTLPIYLTIEQRRLQVLCKFARMNLTTEKNWIDLAKLFDIDIQIIHPSDNSSFDYTFDFHMYDDRKNQRFTMIIKFLHMAAPENVFNCTFDFTFDDTVPFIMCLFDQARPANVHIVYEYELTP
jgi:uncharacterized protein YmfQ (DUF2313 family)